MSSFVREQIARINSTRNIPSSSSITTTTSISSAVVHEPRHVNVLIIGGESTGLEEEVNMSPATKEILRKRSLLYTKDNDRNTSKKNTVVKFDLRQKTSSIDLGSGDTITNSDLRGEIVDPSAEINEEEGEFPFQHKFINEKVLKERAYYRWATLPDGVIPMTAASTDFKVARPIREAIINYTRAGYFNYGPNEGLLSFRKALSNYFTRKLGESHDYDCSMEGEGGCMSVSEKQVMATNAAAAGVYHVAASILTEVGDEALVMTPVDFLLTKSIEALPGRKIIRYEVKCNNNACKIATFSINEMEGLVTPKTKLLSICNPHNPLGRAWSVDELTDLANFAERHNLMIFSDEVWFDVVYEPKTHICTMSVNKAAAERTYTVVGFSKNYGLEGMRVGGLIAPSEEKLNEVLERSFSSTTAAGASTLSQIAATAAMEDEECREWLFNWKDHLHNQMEYAINRLNKMENVVCEFKPQACFVIFANVSKCLGDEMCQEGIEMVLMQYLIDNWKVGIIPGLPEFFGPGSGGHIRISVGTSFENLQEGLNRLEQGLAAFSER